MGSHCALYINHHLYASYRDRKPVDCDSPAIASRFAYGVLQQALTYTDQAQEQLLELGEEGCCPSENRPSIQVQRSSLVFKR